jgi:hypothetical protein
VEAKYPGRPAGSVFGPVAAEVRLAAAAACLVERRNLVEMGNAQEERPAAALPKAHLGPLGVQPWESHQGFPEDAWADGPHPPARLALAVVVQV